MVILNKKGQKKRRLSEFEKNVASRDLVVVRGSEENTKYLIERDCTDDSKLIWVEDPRVVV